MSAVIPTALTIAPRGKVFKVYALVQVQGKQLPVLQPGRHMTRADAEAQAARLGVPSQVMLIDDITGEVSK